MNRLKLCVLAAAAASAALSFPLAAQQPPDLLKSVAFREVGPTRQGGRYVDIAVVESTPQVFYVASSTAGVWKTENNGQTFTLAFDPPGNVASVGAVAVAQSTVVHHGEPTAGHFPGFPRDFT